MKKELNNEQIDSLVKDFFNWGEGCWGDAGLTNLDSHSRRQVWSRIAEICKEKADIYRE